MTILHTEHGLLLVRQTKVTVEELTIGNFYDIYDTELGVLDKNVEFIKIDLRDKKLCLHFKKENSDRFYYNNEDLANLRIESYIGD